MDIRSFFGKKTPEQKPAPSKNEKPSKKKRLIISDSEDDDIVEIPVVKKQKTGPKQQPENSKTESKQKAKVTAAPVDFFGQVAVKKESKPVSKKVEISKKQSRKDDEFSDEEMFEDTTFLDTLKQLDDKSSKKPKENITPPKTAGLSEKLSSRKKVMSWKEKVAEKNADVDRKRSRSEMESSSNSSQPSSEPKNKTPVRNGSAKLLSSPTTPKTSIKPEVTTPKSVTRQNETAEEDTPTQKKKGNTSYWQYKNREGPKNLGSKDIPEGAANCLEGLTFVISGVLDSIERDEAANLIKKYGGRVTAAVSKKTDYLVKGEGCGEKKLEVAEKFNTKQVDEDGLFDLIRSKPGKKSAYDIKVEKEHAKTASVSRVVKKELAEETSSSKKIHSPEGVGVPVKQECSENKSTSHKPGHTDPWTERYRPKRVKDIIGQQGDKSCVNKLLRWLKNWEKWNKPGTKAPFNKDEGSHLKAALLSGPPGVGKTTSATVCSKELGFSFVELNASDARSKKSIKEHVAEILNNHTIAGLTQQGAKGDKHVLIMDEVDGMAGNEDRGGVAELIQLIKTTRIPIICICNNRNHQKIRSLANYCFDLRFYKPRLEQVKGAMMSIAFKEGLKIPPPAMQKIIEGANNDIRQILNHMCMWSAGNKTVTFEEAAMEADRARKDMHLGVFDIPRLLFSGGEETRRYTYADYSDIFFQDYQLSPLFVHENYALSTPMGAPRNSYKSLAALSNAADSICYGDYVNSEIQMQNWSLLPTQAHFSAVMPAYYMRGGISGMVQFPQVLGQTSKKNRCDGLLCDLLNHMILHVSTDKRQLGMEYLPLLKSKLISPLIEKESVGVAEVIATMNSYDLQREDWDTIMELSTFSPNTNPATSVNTKTKSAFTRQYNKDCHMNPYATESSAVKKRKTKVADENSGDEDSAAADEEEEEDAMIKQKKGPPRKAAPAKKAPDAKKAGSKKVPSKSRK